MSGTQGFAPFTIRDLTAVSPPGYVIRPRRIPEVRGIILHQTGFEWAEANQAWSRVRAHFVVHRSGLVSQLHPVTARMRYGCGHGNAWAINIECEGNYPLTYHNGEPVFWMPEKFGRSVLADAPAQIIAARALVAWLAECIGGLRIGAHRQLEEGKGGCCGPDLWREVGEVARAAGMPPVITNGGRDIPASWTGAPIIVPSVDAAPEVPTLAESVQFTPR